MSEAVARAISIPQLADFLCDAINSGSVNRIKDQDRKIFADILQSVYSISNDDFFATVEEFKNDTQEMISNIKDNNEESDSHLSLLCKLIIEALEAGVVKEHQKLLEEILHCVYLSSVRKFYEATYDFVDVARDLIRIIENMNFLYSTIDDE